MPETTAGRTPAERRLAARAAANARWSREPDRRAATAAARRANPTNIEWHARRIDPDGLLLPEERYRRAESARLAYQQGLAARSAKARRARKATPMPDGAARAVGQ